MSNFSGMPDELLLGLHQLAQERRQRTRAATHPYNPSRHEKEDPAYLSAFKEYQDAVAWTNQLWQEIRRRGLQPKESEVA